MRVALLAALTVIAAQDRAELGKVCPDLTLKAIDGQEFKLADLRKSEGKEGSIVVVTFWSYKCPTGEGVMDKWSEAHEALGKIGAKLLGVCTYGESVDELKKYAADHGIAYPLIHDPEGKLARFFGAKVVTHSVVLDPEGKVVYVGGVWRKVKEDTYDFLSAAQDCRAGKELKKSQCDAKG
jgi:peroxiredoxin